MHSALIFWDKEYNINTIVAHLSIIILNNALTS